MANHNKLFGTVGLLIDSKDKDLSFADISQVLTNKNIDFKVFDLLEIAERNSNLLDKNIWNEVSRVLVVISPSNRLAFGHIQAILEILNLPYTGCSMSSMVLSSNIIKSKKIWQAYGISTAPFIKPRSAIDWQEIISLLGFPLAVKSMYTKVNNVLKALSIDQLSSCYDKFEHLDEIIIEPWITGEEYAIYIIDQQTLPPFPVNTNKSLVDRYGLALSSSDVNNMQKLALSAYLALGCLGFAEVRIIRDLNNDFWVSLVNSVPSFSINSQFVSAASNLGISFDLLIEKILATSFINKASHIQAITDGDLSGYKVI